MSKEPRDALTAGRLAPSQGPGEQAGGLPVAHVPETLPRISILRLPLSAVRASLVHVGSLCCPCRVTVPLRRASTLLPYRGSCLLVGVPTLRAGWYDTDAVRQGLVLLLQGMSLQHCRQALPPGLVALRAEACTPCLSHPSG